MEGSMIFFICNSCWDDAAPGIGMPRLFLFHSNVGERIPNSSEQFLLFGADVDENSGIVTILF